MAERDARRQAGREIEAGWAIFGKSAGSAFDYAVLRSSTAHFSPAGYDEILRRFSPGTPKPRSAEPIAAGLPWATVSYAPLRPRPDASAAVGASAGQSATGPRRAASKVEPTVLGIAVCDWTDEVDVAGRAIAGTTYLCAPFDALADRAVSYRNLYDTVRYDHLVAAEVGPDAPGVEAYDERAARTGWVPDLPPSGGGVYPKRLTGMIVDEVADFLRSDRERFEVVAGVAALLLCQPVALLGGRPLAPKRRVNERLQLLDAVAALLPYGQRARLVASTWADAGVAHRVRLTYTDRARKGDAAVRVDGPTSSARLPPLPFLARDYFDLLVDLATRRRIPIEQIIRHLANPAYQQAHTIGDPRHALLSLADLAGPAYFATNLLTSARIRHLTALAAAAPPEDRAPRERAAVSARREHIIAMLRAQRRRGRLGGPTSAKADAAVLDRLAQRGPLGTEVALELVLRAIDEDAKAVAAGSSAAPELGPAWLRAGTGPARGGRPAATARTVGWLSWLNGQELLAARLRGFARAADGRPDTDGIVEIARRGQRGEALALVRLARLAGCGQQLRRPLWQWIVQDWYRLTGLPDDERLAVADAVAELPADLPREKAEIDAARMLLRVHPVEPLRDRMTSPDWREYRGCLLEAYKDVIRAFPDGNDALPVLDRFADTLAHSLNGQGWPAGAAASETLELLERMAKMLLGGHVSRGVRNVVENFLDDPKRPTVDRGLEKRWRDLLDVHPVASSRPDGLGLG